MPEQKNVVEVNTQKMLNIFNFELIAGNFKSDTILVNRFNKVSNSKEKFYWSTLRGIDTVFPRYDFKVIVDTSYTFETNWFEYKINPFPKVIFRDGIFVGDKNLTVEEIEKET